MKLLNQKIRSYYKNNWRTIDFIPAWNYIKFDETSDTRYLLKGIDYECMPELFDIQIARLNQIGESLRFQVLQIELQNNRRNEIIFDIAKKIEMQTADYNEINNICNYMLIAGYDKDFKESLENYKYKIFTENGNIKDQLRQIMSQNENRKIKINEFKAEYDALTKQVDNGKKSTIENTQIIIEKHNGRDIDLKKITMKKWLALKNDYVNEMNRKTNKEIGLKNGR